MRPEHLWILVSERFLEPILHGYQEMKIIHSFHMTLFNKYPQQKKAEYLQGGLPTPFLL